MQHPAGRGVGIPEMEVEASAGPGALAEEFVTERARWFLPAGMIRYAGSASPDAPPCAASAGRIHGARARRG